MKIRYGKSRCMWTKCAEVGFTFIVSTYNFWLIDNDLSHINSWKASFISKSFQARISKIKAHLGEKVKQIKIFLKNTAYTYLQ